MSITVTSNDAAQDAEVNKQTEMNLSSGESGDTKHSSQDGTERQSSDDKESASTGESKKDETAEESETSNEGDESNQDEDDSDDDSGSEGDDSENDDEKDPEKPNKKAKGKGNSGFKRRLKRLNKKVSAAEQEAEYWRREALKNQTQTQKTEETKTTENRQSQESEGRPNADEFETHEEYIDALTDWKVQNALSQKEAQDRQRSTQQELSQKAQTFKTSVDKFAQNHDDFHDVVEDVDDIVMSSTVQEAILDSENGPALMYELAKNRDEYEKICNLSEKAALRAIGKVEARIESTSKNSQRQTTTNKTKAPKPIKTVSSGSGSGGSSKSIYDEDISQAEYERLREKQLR